MKWYKYKSKDKRVQGYCPRSKIKLSGYPKSELILEKVRWNGKEFIKGG